MMRAMSLGLVRGVIDEVDQTFNVTWVQPRVLDKEQLTAVNTQIGVWQAKYVTLIMC